MPENEPPPQSLIKLLSALIRQLQADLSDALDAYSDNRLTGQLKTLWGLNRFLDELGIDLQSRAPLLSVISHLTESYREGAEKRIDELASLVFAAATLDTLMRDGMKQQLAARAVVEAAGLKITTDQLINYRKSLTRRGHSQSLARQLYRELRQQTAVEWGDLSPEDRIKEALDGLRHLVDPLLRPPPKV